MVRNPTSRICGISAFENVSLPTWTHQFLSQANVATRFYNRFTWWVNSVLFKLRYVYFALCDRLKRILPCKMWEKMVRKWFLNPIAKRMMLIIFGVVVSMHRSFHCCPYLMCWFQRHTVDSWTFAFDGDCPFSYVTKVSLFRANINQYSMPQTYISQCLVYGLGASQRLCQVIFVRWGMFTYVSLIYKVIHLRNGKNEVNFLSKTNQLSGAMYNISLSCKISVFHNLYI